MGWEKNMTERNILLTSLGSAEDREALRYFYIKEGKKTKYCDSLGIAEAGTKYILSRQKIDEIIVLGNGATYNQGDELRHIELRKFVGYEAKETDSLSEYSFFRYRISQYLDDLDLEGSDAFADIDPDHRDELIELYNDFAEGSISKDEEGNERTDRMFHLLTTDRRRYQRLLSLLPAETRREDMDWLRYYIYSRLDDDFKLIALPENDDLEICFIPTTEKRISMIPVENITHIVKAIQHVDADRINLYVDMQGAGMTVGNALIQVLSMLSDHGSESLVIKEIISTQVDVESFASLIDNTGLTSYSLNKLVSGMQAFIQFGKVDTIREYWESRHIQNDHIELLLYGMKCVDDGISLCHIGDLEYGISILKKVFAETPKEDLPEMESNIFTILEEVIRSDYGALLEGDEISTIELVKWAFRKHFYQQCMTIIESRIPVDFVRKGLLYYAVDDASKNAMLESLADYYEKTPSKNRWSFDDIDHYFIKYYGRDIIDPKYKGEERDRQYTHLRVESVFHGMDGMIKSFSMIRHRQDLLEETLSAYYRLGPIRNRINHAEAAEDLSCINLDDIDVHRKNKRLSSLTWALRSFIELYEEALSAREPFRKPVQIGKYEFRDYIRSITPDEDYNDYNRNKDGNNEGDGEQK